MLQNCDLYLSREFEFEKGSILFQSDVLISGTNGFIYESVVGSTIDSYSTLNLKNGLTFKYSPARAERNLLFMQDSTSRLFLDGCTLYSTRTGLCLTRGKLLLDNKVIFSSEGIATSEAICFGNGNSVDDLDILLLADAQVEVYGRLEYENSS